MLKRAKPLLGTLVELACIAENTGASIDASELAFAAVARVHGLMSRHEHGSELSAFNRLAPGSWIVVSEETFDVFRFAQTLSAQTSGAFDVFTTSAEAPPGGSWRDLEIDLGNRRLRKHTPLKADLGGIAKGYAVDAAVKALQRGGAIQGWVNAGGDLRVFGPDTLPLEVRAPWNTAELLSCTELHNQAAATSASYWLGTPVLRHGLTRKPADAEASYTVVATECIAADALTKVLAATGRLSSALLEHYQAQAWVFKTPCEKVSVYA